MRPVGEVFTVSYDIIYYYFYFLFAQLHPNGLESGDNGPKRTVRNTGICFLRCCLLW